MVKSAAKECPPGKVINPETGRCVSEKYLLSMKKSPAKKSAAKKAAKSPAKKSAAKKSAAKKAAKSPAKKSAAKKTAKSPAKKSAARKSAARKSAARKSAARKSAARKSAARKSARKSAARKSPARKSAARKSAARKSAAKKSAADSGLKGCTKEGAVCKEGTVCNAETARCGKKTAAMEKMSVLKIGDHEIYGQEQELTRLQKLLGGTIKKTSTSASKKSATRRSAAAATKSPARKSAARKSAARKSAARKSPAAAARKSAARKSPAKKSAPETCFDVPCPKGEVCSASTKKCIKRVAKEHKYLVLDNGNVIVGKEDRLLEVQEQYGGEIHDTNPEAKETQAKKSSPKKSSPSPKKSSPKKSSPKKSRPNVIVEDVDEDAERADESPQAKPKASKATSQEPDVVAARKKLAEGFEKCLASL